MEENSLEKEGKRLADSLHWPLVMVASIWAVQVFSHFGGLELGSWGIYPRRVFGLAGVVTGPLVHGSWAHLMANSTPLFVLAAIIFYFYKRVALPSVVMIYFLTNISVWLLAHPVFHIGASGVVYGMVAFIFWNGLFRGSVRSMVIALVVLVFYSGMFVGILPDQEGISWESHLLGSLVGIFTSYWFRDELEDEEAEQNPFADQAKRSKTPFLPADIFEKTKIERIEEAMRRSEELARQRAEEDAQRGFWTSTWS